MLACTKHRYLIGTERCPFYCLSSSEHRSKSSIEIRKTNCTLLRLHSIIILRIATRNYRNHLKGMWQPFKVIRNIITPVKVFERYLMVESVEPHVRNQGWSLPLYFSETMGHGSPATPPSLALTPANVFHL